MKKLALALLCVLSFSLMLWAARTDSAIDDELAHIPSGYGYVHNLDYRLNPEHPPLVKALAELPVLFLNPVFPTGSDAWQKQVNAQWDMGRMFLYESGNDANAIIQTSRFGPIAITLLLIILIYFAAQALMGPWWALLPAFLFGLDPAVLAHGHYVTTDVGAAFGILLGLYYFLRYIETPSRKNLWYAGIAFGIAQLMKFSTPLLVPLFLFLIVVLIARDAIMRKRRSWHWLRAIALFVIGYVVIVYPIYFLFTASYPIAKQVSDTTAILTSFGGGPTPVGSTCHALRCLADANIWMAGNPVLRPFAEYMLGVLMVIQRADGGNTIYYLGQIRGSGGWSYFPVVFLLKEPIATLIIVLLALGLALYWMLRTAIQLHFRILRRILDYLHLNFAEFSMGSFVIFYWAYSMHSTLNIGFRHLMPTLPLIFILSAGVWKKWLTRFSMNALGNNVLAMLASSMQSLARAIAASVLKYAFLGALLVWLLIETLVAAPYFLSYFNEFGGGVWGGYHYVTDSNYDWGQDLIRLQSWVNAHPEVDKIAVDYFGGGNAKYYLGDKEVDWSSGKGDPAAQGIHWVAISVNQLQGGIEPLAPGQSRKPEDSYPWLLATHPIPPGSGMGEVPKPDARAGTSIFIYHL